MNARQRKSPVTDILRHTIAESGIPYNQLERETGVKRVSIIRFVRGEQSMRLDLAERLMVYFGLEVCKRKRDRSKSRRQRQEIGRGRPIRKTAPADGVKEHTGEVAWNAQWMRMYRPSPALTASPSWLG